MTIARPSAEPRIAPVPRNLLDALRAAGVDPVALAESLGLVPASLEAGLGVMEADRFFVAAWEAVADPTIGLTAGCMIQPERFGIVGLAAMASPTFGAAIERKARYWRLIWGDAYEVRRQGDEAAAVLVPTGPHRPYTQAKVDMELASLLAFGRRFTGRAIAPLRLELAQAAPAWKDRYREVFGCPVAFGQSENALVFSAADLALPLVSHNPEVAALMDGGAEAALARLGDAPLRDRVGAVVDRMLQGDEPTLAAAATQLHMSARTLQRLLAQEDLRFTDVLDERRRVAAERHLDGGRATAEEVAFLLGFATPSSFFRAFKRWTGTTPDAWRKKARAGRASSVGVAAS